MKQEINLQARKQQRKVVFLMGGLKDLVCILNHYERLVNPVCIWVGKFLWVISQVNLSILFFFFFPHITDTQVFTMNYIFAWRLIQFILKKTYWTNILNKNTIQVPLFWKHILMSLHCSWNCAFSVVILNFTIYLRNGKISVFPVMFVCGCFSSLWI